MSILKVNVNELKTSIAKNRIFMLGYKQMIKTKQNHKEKIGKKKITPSTMHFLKTKLSK